MADTSSLIYCRDVEIVKRARVIADYALGRYEFSRMRIGLAPRDLLRQYDYATEAGNALRMACGEAILVTTAEEVRMPRVDWDRIVEAAIAQRRAVDGLAVDDA